jgi:hypothetical protein
LRTLPDHPTPSAVAGYIGRQIAESRDLESDEGKPRLPEPDDEKARSILRMIPMSDLPAAGQTFSPRQ